MKYHWHWNFVTNSFNRKLRRYSWENAGGHVGENEGLNVNCFGASPPHLHEECDPIEPRDAHVHLPPPVNNPGDEEAQKKG